MAMFALSRRMSRRFSRTLAIFQPQSSRKNNDLDDLDRSVVRHKPEGLDALSRTTKFSRKELQVMYRGFKQDCPSGVVDEESFLRIYAQFFPHGDSDAYASYVFNTFDEDHNGTITFEDLMIGLSTIARGSFHDKLQWAFSLYDINRDGVITREEMYDIILAVYDLMGKHAVPDLDEDSARGHVEDVFQKMDLNNDGVISWDEFMDTCQKDQVIYSSMAMFDTVL